MAQSSPSPASPKPHKIVFQATADLADDRQIVTESSYLSIISSVVTGVTYRIGAKIGNVSSEPFPGGKLIDVSVSSESVSAALNAEIGIPPIGTGPNSTVEIDLGEYRFPLPGMNWVRGQVVAIDGRPVVVVKGKREIADGRVESGFPATLLEAALTVELLTRIVASRPPSEERK